MSLKYLNIFTLSKKCRSQSKVKYIIFVKQILRKKKQNKKALGIMDISGLGFGFLVWILFQVSGILIFVSIIKSDRYPKYLVHHVSLNSRDGLYTHLPSADLVETCLPVGPLQSPSLSGAPAWMMNDRATSLDTAPPPRMSVCLGR